MFVISEQVRGYTATGLSYTLAGIGLTFLVTLMTLLQPYKSRRVNNYHIVLMLILAMISFLTAIVAQSKANWIIHTGIILIGLLCTSPLLFVISYIVIYHTPCRRFKQYWLKFDGNPELESLLSTNNRD